MNAITLQEETVLNQLLYSNELRAGTARVIPLTEGFPFIKVNNPVEAFKMPEVMKSVETLKSYSNKPKRMTKVMWIMDLKNGTRLLSYPNPQVRKIIHNNRLTDEIKLLPCGYLVPSNVVTLWRLDATYLIEDEKLVYDHAEIRQYK